MVGNKIVAPKNSLKLVFAWVVHPVLGNLIEAYAVNLLHKGHFSYEYYRLSCKTIDDYLSNLSSTERSILSACEKYSEEVLQKKFRQGGIISRNFLSELDADLVKRHIRPYVDKQLSLICDLLEKNSIPLYYKGERNERIKEDPIHVLPCLADVVFFFERLEDETHYWLQVQYEGENVELKGKDAALLSEQPCVMKVENQLFRFPAHVDGRKLKPFFNKEYVIVPKSSELAYYKSFVLKAVASNKVVSKGFRIIDVHQPPQPIMSIENNWKGELVFQLYFKYSAAWKVHLYETEKIVNTYFNEIDGEFVYHKIFRQFPAERHYADVLKAMGLRDKGSEGFLIAELDELVEQQESLNPELLPDMVEWLSNHSAQLYEQGFVIDQKMPGGENYFIGTPDLLIDVSEKTDWFDLHAVVVFGNHRIPFIRLKSFILQGIRKFPLPDGTFGIIPSEWFGRFHEVFRFADSSGENISLKKHHFTLLKQAAGDQVQVPVFSTSEGNFKAPGIHPGFRAELRTYQKKGYDWLNFLYQNKLGGCLADDMGLGKTIQTLALLSHVHKDPDGKNENDDAAEDVFTAKAPGYSSQLSLFKQDYKEEKTLSPASLIIMPLSLIQNWIQEIHKFAPYLRVLQHTGAGRSTSHEIFSRYDIILSTYGTVRNDINWLSLYKFKYVILDESQIIKNPESRIYQSIKTLRSCHRLVLTGTPVENSLTDLWSQFSFLNPGMLGSRNFFRKEYVQPIERNKEDIKSEKLQNLIKPFILRRTKAQVATDLPSLTQANRYCEMTAEHKSIYEKRKSQVRNIILEQLEGQGLDKSRFMILSGLMKLRLLANHPLLAEEGYSFESGKFLEVNRNLEKLLYQ